MYYLGIGYLFMISVFLLIVLEGEWLIINTINLIVHLSILTFTHKTYYRNRKSPILLFVIIIFGAYIGMQAKVILTTSAIIQSTQLVSIIDQLFSVIFSFLTFGWLGYASIKSFQSLEQDDIEPWIKKRLLLVSYSAFIEMLFNIEFANPENLASIVLMYMMVLIILIFGVTQFFAWLMPTRLKLYLNKGYTLVSDEEYASMSEEDIMKQLEGS
jgi:hypothetical protein